MSNLYVEINMDAKVIFYVGQVREKEREGENHGENIGGGHEN